MITMRIKRKKADGGEEQVKVSTPPDIVPEPPEAEKARPSGNGQNDFQPANTPDWLNMLANQQGVQVDLNEIMRFIASPEGEQKHVFSDIMPHQVIDMMRMDYDDYLSDPNDLRTPQQVIRDSYCKWRRAVNRELIKDMHRIISHYPVKEDGGEGGIIP